MSNRKKNGIYAVRPEDRNEAGQFKKGVSGNPGGRPKRTPEELQAIEDMKQLTPTAVKVVKGILENDHASVYARLQAAELIFNRAMGRPETYLKVDNADHSVESSVARLQSLFGSVDEDDADSDSADRPDHSVDPERSADSEDSAVSEDSSVSEVNADAG